MGHGIAQEFAVAGFSVRLHDVSEEKLDQALSRIDANLDLLHRHGLVADRLQEPVRGRITTTTDLKQAADGADLVIEAVFEDIAVKHDVFSSLDTLAPEHTILASNTSTFMPSTLAEATKRPDRVLVTHYFNPPYLLPLVEVVGSPTTAPEVIEAVVALLTAVGKRPTVLKREVPGFVVNRLQVALLREAVSLVEQGVASPQDIDLVVKNSFGRRLAAAGPFQVFDSAGWDTILSVISQLIPELDVSPEVPSLVEEMVNRGDLGIKSGRGFYDWTPEAESAFRQNITETLATIHRLSSNTNPNP